MGDGEDEHSTSSIADLVDGVLAEIYQVGTVRTDIDPLFQLQQKILKMMLFLMLQRFPVESKGRRKKL